MTGDRAVEPPFVSTGSLPSRECVQALVVEAYERYRSSCDGAVSEVYPVLARMPSELFGVCVVGASGNVYAAGDADVEFSLMSVAKPFVFALVCQRLGPEDVRSMLGVNATGLPFNSLSAIERARDGRTNPMVNPGAIATASLVPGANADDRWSFLLDGLSRFAGRDLSLDDELYRSVSETNHRNSGIVSLLESYGRLACPPDEALDLYTRQSSLSVTATDLAAMGATLADGA